MSDQSAPTPGGPGDAGLPRPRIIIDTEVGRLNRGQPDRDAIARELPEWDLLPPHALVERSGR